jgi:HK97 family phage major capsid protein
MSIVQKNIDRLLAEREAAWGRDGQPLADIAATRDLTADETRSFEAASSAFDGFSERIASLEVSLEQERAVQQLGAALAGQSDAALDQRAEMWRNMESGEPAALRHGQSIRSHPVFERAHNAGAGGDIAEANYGNLGAMVRALATGSGGGSAIVPTTWAANLIDLARSKSAVIEAGATIVPMDAGTVKIGRRTGDPTVGFRAENSAITPSDPSFDTVTLEARTVAGIVVASLEWWQDVEHSDQIVQDALAASIAQQIDLVALYGGVTAGAGSIDLATPPNPRGILAALNATLSANVLGGATNGTVQTAAGSGNYWGEVIESVFKVKRGNENPNAIIWNSSLAQQYALATDTTGQPLAIPPAVADLRRFESNKLPSYTQGTMADRANDVFVGDFAQLLIGSRLSIQLKPLGELYAGNGQLGVMAVARVDVQPARAAAFAVYRALQGAA